MENLLFYILTFLSEILGTLGGFGSSVFFVPMASWFYSFQSVLGLTALYHLFSNFSKIILFKEGFDKKILLNIGIPSVVFVVLGALGSRYIEEDIGNLILGIFLIVFSGVLLVRPSFKLKNTTTNARLGGSISGLTAGLLGTGGAIRGLTLASFDISKNTFLATSAMIDMGIDSSRFLVYLAQGYISKDMLWQAPILLLLSFVGSYFGKLILNKISQDLFKKLSLWLVLVVGISLIFKVWVG